MVCPAEELVSQESGEKCEELGRGWLRRYSHLEETPESGSSRCFAFLQ